jgi:CRP/FNR family transcriptional regulator
LIRDAIARSFLARLPKSALDELLEGATTEEVTAGTLTYRPAADPRAALVVSGLFRVYYESSDGRQVTIRYARPGDVLGVVAAAGGPAPVHTQALTDATRLVMDMETLRSLARHDPEVAWGMVEELSRMVYSLWHELADTAFASVPQRVARHLLEIAATQQETGAPLVARVSQQELADLAGSVREVVARALRDLRGEGIVRVTRAGITVLDPSRLAERAWSS